MTPPGQTSQLCRVAGCQPTRVVTVPGCGAAPPRVAIELDPALGSLSYVTTYSVDGSPRGDLDIGAVEVRLLGGGCVSDATGALCQSTAVSAPNMGVNYALIACPNRAPGLARWSGFGGAGFVDDASGEARLVGSELDVDGVALVEWVVAPDGGTGYVLVERRRQSIAAPAASVVTGRFDGDATLDLAWLLEGVTGRARLQVALDTGDLPGGVRLMGISPEYQSDAARDAAQILGADLDDDGTDDVIGYRQSEVVVYPMGVTVP
jgi:hypothetical protein